MLRLSPRLSAPEDREDVEDRARPERSVGLGLLADEAEKVSFIDVIHAQAPERGDQAPMDADLGRITQI